MRVAPRFPSVSAPALSARSLLLQSTQEPLRLSCPGMSSRVDLRFSLAVSTFKRIQHSNCSRRARSQSSTPPPLTRSGESILVLELSVRTEVTHVSTRGERIPPRQSSLTIKAFFCSSAGKSSAKHVANDKLKKIGRNETKNANPNCE